MKILKELVLKNDELLMFLKSIKLEKYYNMFIEHGINKISYLKPMGITELFGIGIKKVNDCTLIVNELKKYND